MNRVSVSIRSGYVQHNNIVRPDVSTNKKVTTIFAAKMSLEESCEKYDEVMKGMPKSQRHIQFIDKPKWEQTLPYPKVDKKRFDNEPGYFNAMTRVHEFIRKNLGQRYDAKKLCGLHDLCVDGVYKTRRGNELFQKGYAPGWRYEFYLEKTTPEALKELEEEKLVYFPKEEEKGQLPSEKKFGYLSYYKVVDGKGYICSNFTDSSDEEAVLEIIDHLFDRYYESIDNAKSDYDKLAAIARLNRALNIFHVFPDGNGRTLLWALCPQLLIENGFCPSIFENPNKVLAGRFSVEQMVDQFIEGMNNFKTAVTQYAETDDNLDDLIFL